MVFGTVIFLNDLEKEKTAGLNAYEEMMKGISEIAPGSDGLITLPTLREKGHR